MTLAKLRRPIRDARGAVFVEKLIVYLPLLMTFFGAWELAELGAAKLVVQRACAAAGRAAMVVLPDDPVFYDDEPVGSYDGQRRADIELAAGMILSAVPRLREDFEVDVTDAPGDTTGTIDVSLTAPYDCGLVSLVCGDDDSIQLTAASTHQYHGAKYAYSSAALGGSTGALIRSGNRPDSSGPATGEAGFRTKRPGSPLEGGTTPPGPSERCVGDPCADTSWIKKVYRVIRPEEDPSVGIFPKDPNGTKTIGSHVGAGSNKGYTSQFISTTLSLEVAMYHACKSGKGARIVEIDVTQVGGQKADLSCGTHPDLPGATAGNFAISSQEVLLEGTIPPGALNVVYTDPNPRAGSESKCKKQKAAKDAYVKGQKARRDRAKAIVAECACAKHGGGA
jgi:hypothetical protein